MTKGRRGEIGRGAKDGWSEATAAASDCVTMRSSLIQHITITNNLLLVASLLAPLIAAPTMKWSLITRTRVDLI